MLGAQDFRAGLDAFSKAAGELGIAEECTCQKTDGNCKMGAECFATGAVGLMKLVPQLAPA